MVNQPTIEQWEKLYEVACNIKKIQPWNALWDTDIITIKLPNRNEEIFVSTMGRNGECYGIGVYPGYEEMNALSDMMSSMQNNDASDPLFYQNCIMCYFGNRDELTTKERAIIKELGLKFRGADNWIYFRRMKPGYYPWFLTSDEVNLMTEALQNYIMAALCVLENKFSVDFEQNETLIRVYSEERKEWINFATPMPEIPRKMLVVNEVELIERVKSMPKTKSVIEIDRVFIPAPVQEKKTDIPYFPSLIAILERNSRECIMYDTINNDEDNAILLSMMIDYIERYGKPAKIFVRNDRTACYFYDFCKKTGINLVSNQGMHYFDEFAEGMLAFVGN